MNTTNSPLSPITFEITSQGAEGFKSIHNLTWENIPPFAILTGLNGAGKSQLLLFLAYALNKATDPNLKDVSNLSLSVKGDSFEPGDISYVPNSGDRIHGGEVSVGDLRNIKQETYKNFHQRRSDPTIYSRIFSRWLTKIMGIDPSSLSETDFLKRIPDDLAFALHDDNIVNGLVHVFLAYRIQLLQELEKGTSRAEINDKLGPAPWDVLNEILAVAQFPYRVDAPTQSLLESYKFLLKDGAITINPQDLSSGEKVILQLALWLYSSENHNRFPRLLLLDEPDSHLHPSMTRQLMDVLQRVMVERYKVRIIATTHSPSTVALAPDGSLFEMTRGSTKILPSGSRAETIGLLTTGLVVVSRTSRYVLVEDEADVDFFSAIRDILSDYGPSKDPKALAPAPSIVFLPASSGQGKDKIGGGKGAVISWVEKFDAPPLNVLIRGIIDQDDGNAGTDRILTLRRYSIENYLLDPCVIFGILVESGMAPALPRVSITAGDEHLIRNLHYPIWMKRRRGHDLYRLYQQAFGGAGLISPPRLMKSMQRVRLMPKELADLMHKLQNG